jgi:hypothetical protein
MTIKAQATKTQETKSATSVPTAQKLFHNSMVEEAYAPLFLMQETLGNQAVQQWARTGVQRKIKIGSANDIYEQEADRVADHVMRMPDPAVICRQSSVGALQRKSGCPFAKCASCKDDELFQTKAVTMPATSLILKKEVQLQPEEEEAKIQAKGSGMDERTAPDYVENRLQVSGAGRALPESVRSFFEPRFGYDFSGVLIHADSSAAMTAASINAQAFTHGRDIYFGSNRYRPDTSSGKMLLAHELTHVVQQHGGRKIISKSGYLKINQNSEAGTESNRLFGGGKAGPLTSLRDTMLQLAPDPATMPPPSILRASLQGFQFIPAETKKFLPGLPEPQALGMLLRRLLGKTYTPELNDAIYLILKPEGGNLFTPAMTDETGTQDFPPVFADTEAMNVLIMILKGNGFTVELSKEHQDYLQLGLAARQAWGDVKGLPLWYNRELFLTMITRNIGMLRQYQAEMQSSGITPLTNQPSTEEMKAVADSIASALNPAAQVVEAIRTDPALTGHTVYKTLWPPQPQKPPAAPSDGATLTPKQSATAADAPMAAADRAPNHDTAAGFLVFITSQPDLAKDAVDPDPETGAPARLELLNRYQQYLGWKPEATQHGDQPLSDQPSPYNAPPFPARLYSTPPVEPPFFDVSTRGEYALTMAVEYPNIWAAWGYKAFNFESIRVPKGEVVGASKRSEALPGEEASQWTMLKARLAKDQDYNEADLRRYYGSLGAQLGPVGVAGNLFAINALLRFTGSAIRTGFQKLADSPWVARMNFPEEGVYVVRATATWPREERQFVVRPPSVAYLPVFARAPEILAESRLEQSQPERADVEKRLAEIREELKKPGADTTKLMDEQSMLSAEIGGAFELLNYQRLQLVQQLNKADPSQKEKIQQRIDQIDAILVKRNKLGLGAYERRFPTVFVTDAGDVLHLLIEAKRLNPENMDKQTWLIVDSTTPKGKTATGEASGNDEEGAIRKGVKDLLEQGGYGRGNAAVAYDKEIIAIRVEASGTALLKEALSNTALLLSIVAVAAAPFTGGESLVLLIPAGIIGAVPSAMNIIERGIDKTLKLDLETGLDIVNIVGAFVMLGAEARAAGLIARPFAGGALLVTGLGAAGSGMILMGAKLMEDIKATEELPPELRAAALMEIIGNAMLTAGIMIGGLLVARSRAAGEKGVANPRIDFAGWWESLDDPTRAELDKPANVQVKAAYIRMKPRVRELLSTCGSFCVPLYPPPTDAEVLIIDKLADKLNASEQRWFKGLLHENAGPGLGKLLRGLETVPDANINSMIRSLGDPASAVLVAFSEKVKGFSDSSKNTPEQQTLRDQATRVVNAGKIPIESIGKILDNVRVTSGGDPLKMLQYLEELGNHQVPGWDKVVQDLGGYRNFHKGATWVLRYITESRLWEKLQAFEVEAEPGGRRWDCRIGGQRYQFKSWSRFYEATFRQQILQDYRWSNGFRDFIVKWVFEQGLGSAEEIRAMMNKTIDEAVTAGDARFTPEIVTNIKATLPTMVEVGSVPPTP